MSEQAFDPDLQREQELMEALRSANRRIVELEAVVEDFRNHIENLEAAPTESDLIAARARVAELEAERDAHQKMGAEGILRIVKLAKLLENIQEAAWGVIAWHDRDGSVGGCELVIEDLRAALAAAPQEDQTNE